MSGIFTDVIGHLRKAMPRRTNIITLHINKELFNKMKTYEGINNEEYVVLQVCTDSLRNVMNEEFTLAKINGRMEEEE